ncbi:hypothetical protein [Streptomyces sp. PSKA30]|uniref:hypothetical protein n=1 Tax=Streptomyces sp. PSKA30 TaxID=2874597 RepID=UPI001CD0DE51|nr:hypothetical protein [Streptomyces sp. PSKA30]MBZ9643954.1 hypothetical protein [Streptomyces sp. PSKA30]
MVTGGEYSSLQEFQQIVRDRLAADIAFNDGGLGGGHGHDTGRLGTSSGVILGQVVETPLVLGRDYWYDPDHPDALVHLGFVAFVTGSVAYSSDYSSEPSIWLLPR